MIALTYTINQSILKECPAINCQLFFSRKEGLAKRVVEIPTVEEGEEAFYAHALSELMRSYKIPEEEHLGNLLVIANVFWIEQENRNDASIDYEETWRMLKFLKKYKEVEAEYMRKEKLVNMFKKKAFFQINIGSDKIVLNDGWLTHFMVKSLYRSFRESVHNDLTWSLGDPNTIPSVEELELVISSTNPNRGALTTTINHLLWYVQNHMKGLLVRKEYRFLFDFLNLLDLTKEAGTVNGHNAVTRYRRPTNYLALNVSAVINDNKIKSSSNDKTAFIKEKSAFIKALVESTKRKGDGGLSVVERP